MNVVQAVFPGDVILEASMTLPGVHLTRSSYHLFVVLVEVGEKRSPLYEMVAVLQSINNDPPVRIPTSSAALPLGPSTDIINIACPPPAVNVDALVPSVFRSMTVTSEVEVMSYCSTVLVRLHPARSTRSDARTRDLGMSG